MCLWDTAVQESKFPSWATMPRNISMLLSGFLSTMVPFALLFMQLHSAPVLLSHSLAPSTRHWG